MPAPRMPREPESPTGPTPFMLSPEQHAPQEQPMMRPRRAADDEGMRPDPHRIRPVEDYVEYEEENRLHIPREMIPEGFDLQWVTSSVWGRPETQHRARFERQGWIPVHQHHFDSRFRGMFMTSTLPGEIEVDGLVLMARSMSWSEKARQLDKRRARERVVIKEHQLQRGDLNGVTLAADHPTAVRSNIIARSIETVAMPVPEK